MVQPPPVNGIGNAGGFRMMIEDRDGQGPLALRNAVYAMMGAAAQTPGLQQVYSLFETSTPQIYLDIDRAKAQMLQVNVSDVFSALQSYIGSTYVNDFNLFSRTFRVQVQADAPYRKEVKDILSIRVKNANGDTVPLGSFTRFRTSPVPTGCRAITSIRRRNSTAARPRLLAGSGDRDHAATRRQGAAAGFAYEWTTLAYQQQRAGKHRHLRLRAGRGVRFWCWRRSMKA